MELQFRWYGHDDPIDIKYIRQIPGVKGIVSAVYDVEVGMVWPKSKIRELKQEIERNGLSFTTVESVPVHESIKAGLSDRDIYIENYKQTLRNLGDCGIKVVCYNFMPVFDWVRTTLNYELNDGSFALALLSEDEDKYDPRQDSLSLPGWDESYSSTELREILELYGGIGKDELRENLSYFIKEIIPVAEEVGIKMAVHPDDPPWDIFGIPRILSTMKDFDYFLNISDSSSHGITFCSGSLGIDTELDLSKFLNRYVNRVNFVHFRNVINLGRNSFTEVAHNDKRGVVDFYELSKILIENNYSGPYRPDHGRDIWGERGNPGYGLYDRALGANYLEGVIEGVKRSIKDEKNR